MRRSLVAMVLTGIVVVGSGTAGAAGDDTPARPGLRDYAARWRDASSKERNAAGDLIVETDDAAAPWHDVEAAIADGFLPNRPGVGPVHHRNVANRRDDRVLDPAHPEALVYLHRRDGDPVLLGVVYAVVGGQERPLPAGDLAAWHVHHAPGCHHPDVDEGCGDVRGGMLHVWLYDGVVDPFADLMFASMGSRPAWRQKLTDLATRFA